MVHCESTVIVTVAVTAQHIATVHLLLPTQTIVKHPAPQYHLIQIYLDFLLDLQFNPKFLQCIKAISQ